MFPSCSVRWMAGAGLGLLTLVSTGCMLPIAYAYPTYQSTPALQIDGPVEEVHAFRVNITDDKAHGISPVTDQYVLSSVPITESGYVAGQGQMTLEYGWVLISAMQMDGRVVSHGLELRLYRPGWRAVESVAGDKSLRITWQPASRLEDQESEIDKLLSTWATDLPFICTKPSGHQISPNDERVFRNLAPGSASEEHRRALEFAAAEYSRLIQLASLDVSKQSMVDRLKAKAKCLSLLADR